MLLCNAVAQVGGDVVDLNQGLIAKWDEVMPLDLNHPLALPKSADGIMLENFAVAFAIKLDAFPGGDHVKDVLWLESKGGAQMHFDVGSQRGIVLRCAWKPDDWLAMPAMNAAGRWEHVTLNVKRDPRQAQSGLWLNGVEQLSWKEPLGGIEVREAAFLLSGTMSKGQITNLRFYNRALNRPEILELAAMPPMAGLKPKLVPFSGSMKLMTEEVIAVLGGTEAEAVMEDGTMEALLMTQFPGSRVKVRNLAWEADTVFRQDRPMNFGGLKQQIERTGATAVMLMFGRQECFERGEDGIPEFRGALEKMVKVCAEVTPRLVLMEPLAFEGELSKHNATLKKYAAVMAEVAKAHGALFVAQKGEIKPGATRDGLNLTSAGAAQWGMGIAKMWDGDPKKTDGRLKALIGEKNTLWHRYWRPANWAFLHGDRTAQPSSRDHVDPTQRWFPGEVEQYKPLIEAKENEIWKLANELGGKLP
ncbi:LamG-like jellyroll fold domain-containing protein [Prosthecobacter sp.]|uniref:LamG-like jellyroll fold domain-containing protein n=1 Tax=Prosthecobacter sp. TaxID=1965333 RepID=UPI001DA5CFF2|nr:LamG-like jellyroll fold domain-containing protein [Prosthecobacter sp.]MCB1277091.1 hypothetical protein [Prosthecobacter sp.]